MLSPYNLSAYWSWLGWNRRNNAFPLQLVRLLEQVGLKQKEQCFPLTTCPLTRVGVAETEGTMLLLSPCNLSVYWSRLGWNRRNNAFPLQLVRLLEQVGLKQKEQCFPLATCPLTRAGVAETKGTMLSPYNLSAYWSRLGWNRRNNAFPLQLVRLLEQVGLKQKEQCFPLTTCPLTRVGVAETEGTMLSPYNLSAYWSRLGWNRINNAFPLQLVHLLEQVWLKQKEQCFPLKTCPLTGAGWAETEGTMLSPCNLSAY